MAHTLTFNNSDFNNGVNSITVNDVVVTSPYTITSNATIQWTFLGKSTAVIVNGVRYETGKTNKLTLTNTDIDITVEHSSGAFTPSNEGTINYTESVTPTLTFKHFFDAGTIGSGTVKFRHYSQTELGPQFVQIPVTKTANNYSQISSLKKDKSYTVFTYNEGDPMIAGVISYNGSNWVTSSGASIYIKEQTSDSVQFINYNASYFLLWQSGAVFEADKALDFADLDAAGITVDEQDIIAYWACMLKGTLITLADGTKKPIEQITYDDDLLVWNFYEGKFDTAKPCWIKIPQIAHEYNLCKFSNGAEVGFVGEGGSKGYHRIYNNEAKCFTHTGVVETPIGTTTFAEDMSMPTLVEQEVVKKEVKYYNIITDKHYNLFANGILTSCKLSNKYAIENMKYVGEQLITDEEERAYFERIEDIKR